MYDRTPALVLVFDFFREDAGVDDYVGLRPTLDALGAVELSRSCYAVETEIEATPIFEGIEPLLGRGDHLLAVGAYAFVGEHDSDVISWLSKRLTMPC